MKSGRDEIGGTGKDELGEEDEEVVEKRRGGDLVDEEEEEELIVGDSDDEEEMAAFSLTPPSLAQMRASGKGGDEMLRGKGNSEKMSSEISGSFAVAAAAAAAAAAVPAPQSS